MKIWAKMYRKVELYWCWTPCWLWIHHASMEATYSAYLFIFNPALFYFEKLTPYGSCIIKISNIFSAVGLVVRFEIGHSNIFLYQCISQSSFTADRYYCMFVNYIYTLGCLFCCLAGGPESGDAGPGDVRHHGGGEDTNTQPASEERAGPMHDETHHHPTHSASTWCVPKPHQAPECVFTSLSLPLEATRWMK